MEFKDLVIIDSAGNRYILIPEPRAPFEKSASGAPIQIQQNIALSASPIADFRIKLKNFRKAANISQTALAQAAGTKQPNITAIENGKRRPRPDTERALISALVKLSGIPWR